MDERQDYETPRSLVASLSLAFGPFDVDVAATEANKKAPRCFTPEVDGLRQDWTGLRAFMNPPYGMATAAWVRKAATEKARTTCILPARTDTRWFHDYIWDAEHHRPRPNVVAFRLLKGRIKFEIDGKPVLDPKTGKPAGGKFPSMVVVFGNLDGGA
jgi:site-specific DNA-methyltransferase (adenine-specific)